MEYTRICPKCNKEIIHKNKYSCRQHEKLNKMCASCSRKDFFLKNPEAITKMSQERIGKRTGRDNHNFGKKISEEQKEKFRSKMVGRKLTPEHVKNATDALQAKYKSGELTKKHFYVHWVEKYGEEIATQKYEETKKKNSESSKGAGNPMFGKPSPKGSGNGWKCWYGDYFCRSLRELMFILKLEAEDLKWKTGECQKIQIKYLDYKGQERNYFPDFIVGSIMYEVKPKRLWDTPLIKAKTEAAKKYCAERDMTFEIVDIAIDFKVVNDLYNVGKIKFSEKYEKKFIEFRGNIKE